MQGRGRKRGAEDPSGLRVGSNEPDVGLKLTNHEIMTGAEVGCSTDQAPRCHYTSLFFSYRILYGPWCEFQVR